MLVEQRGQQLCELQGQKANSRAKRNRRRSKKPMISVVQQLLQTCKEVFASGEAGDVPSPEDVEKIRLVLERMKPEDVGLTQDLPCFRMIEKDGVPPISYLHVYACDKFSIGIFCLPPSGVIPLHNHPGMTVFSKLLLGSMHIKSYDWATDAPNNTTEDLSPSQMVALQPPGARLAKIHTDAVFTAPCNTSILYPAAGGNMHCFTAVTSCAVLDVLGPPYNDAEGRHCMYYREIPFARNLDDGILHLANADDDAKEKFAWLEEREKPEDFVVLGTLYRGPK